MSGPAIFSHFGVTPPGHWGYVQFPALLLIIFALMFFTVAARPQANRNLICYGILLKLSYAGLVLYYWLGSGVPGMWKGPTIADLLFETGLDGYKNPRGIGLSAWRFNLGAGSSRQSNISDSWRRADTFLDANLLGYDWSRCPGQRWFTGSDQSRRFTFSTVRRS
jgi:hypothetical protein